MNVIFIILDSLRMDHIGCYGDCYSHNPRARTPRLDQLARESLRFTRTAAESLPTLPMRRAVHTGQRVWPFWEHEGFKGDFVGAPGWGPMHEEQDTVAELLQEAGYRTAFVTDTYHQFKPSKNFHRGFQSWQWIRGQECDPYRTGPHIPDEQIIRHIPEPFRNEGFIQRHRQYLMNVAERRSEEDYFPARVFRTAAEWLYQNQDAEKFFLVADSFDPHEPWDPPQHYRKMYDPSGQDDVTDVIWTPYGTEGYEKQSPEELRRMQANYSGEVTMVDRWVGHLLEAARDAGVLDNTLVIVTADHGHYLGYEKRTGKMGHPLLPGVAHIPLLIRDPSARSAGQTNDAFTCHTDIAATILDAAGVSPRQELHGQSLMPTFGGAAGPDRDHTLTAWGPFITIRTDRWWYNASLWGHDPLLYDLHEDPECERSVADENPAVVQEMHELGKKDCGGKYPSYLRDKVDAALPGCTPLGKW